MKERIQQAGFAAVLGGLAGAALTARRGRAAVAAGTVAGAAGLAAADAVARARQRPNEIPALWSRILASGAMAAPLGWTADRLARSSLSRAEDPAAATPGPVLPGVRGSDPSRWLRWRVRRPGRSGCDRRRSCWDRWREPWWVSA